MVTVESESGRDSRALQKLWRHAPELSVVLASLMAGILEMVLSLHKYWTLHAATMDLGYFLGAFWQISHGYWGAYSLVFHSPALGTDLSLWLYPVAYWERLTGVVGLFAIQSAGTMLAAWGIWRAARLHGLAPWHRAAVALAFLCFPAIVGGAQFDWHPDFIALPCLVWAYVWQREGRPWRFWIAAICAAAAKDVALLGLAGFGVGLILGRRAPRDGWILAVGGVFLFWFEVSWAIPHWLQGGTTALQWAFYGYLGHGPIGILTGIALHPGAVLRQLLTVGLPYAALVLAPVLGLPLGGQAAMAGLTAAWGLNALSSLPAQHSLFDQYSVMVAAWLYLAVIETLARLGPRYRRHAVLALVLVSLAIQAVFTSTVTVHTLAFKPAPIAAVQAAVRAIPHGSVVYTTSALGPQVARRRVFGTDSLATPSLMLDPLSAVWAVGHQDGLQTTTLLAQIPVNPYFGYLLARALSSGYRVRLAKDGVVMLVGHAHFAVANPQETTAGLEPLGTRWSEPWWTQSHNLTAVRWTGDGLGMAHTGQRRIAATLSLWMPAGRYDLSFTASTSAVRTASLGWWTFRAPGRKTVRGVARTGLNTLKVSLATSAMVTIQLGNAGTGSWVASPLHIRRVSSRTPAGLGMGEFSLYRLESLRPAPCGNPQRAFAGI